MPQDDIAQHIALIRGELEDAADRLMTSLETALRGLNQIGAAEDAVSVTRDALCEGLEACAFQDLVGQRLSQLEAMIAGAMPAADSLLNGPATPGGGLDQAAADAVLSGAA